MEITINYYGMRAPIRFSGENFRRATAQDKLARLKI